MSTSWLPRRLRRLVSLLLLLLVCFVPCGFARDAPQNLREFFDAVRKKGHCTNKLATGFYSSDNGPNTFCYCGDHLDSSGILYIQGLDGHLANMDVDCDGSSNNNNGTANDGRCRQSLSPDEQNSTTFRDTLTGYNKGIADLNPYVHPYIVLGNARGTPGRNRRGWRSFDPTSYGVQPLSVAAVVGPGGQLWFGVWGDTNGDDGAKPMVGEASLAMATFFGGAGVNGNSGLDADDYLYIVFRGPEAVPGPEGANWTAKDAASFEASIGGLGMSLVERVQADGAAPGFGRVPCDGWLSPAQAAAAAAVSVTLWFWS